jgi:hypothetical protein
VYRRCTDIDTDSSDITIGCSRYIRIYINIGRNKEKQIYTDTPNAVDNYEVNTRTLPEINIKYNVHAAVDIKY